MELMVKLVVISVTPLRSCYRPGGTLIAAPSRYYVAIT